MRGGTHERRDGRWSTETLSVRGERVQSRNTVGIPDGGGDIVGVAIGFSSVAASPWLNARRSARIRAKRTERDGE